MIYTGHPALFGQQSHGGYDKDISLMEGGKQEMRRGILMWNLPGKQPIC
jgi:hypothetical protein